MNWTDFLQDDERLQWQGKPAPRCYTFRNWQHSIFGLIILIASVCWLLYGIRVGAEYQSAAFTLIPVPFIVAGGYLCFGHLILSRLEWNNVCYALTDRRLLARRGLGNGRIAELAIDDIVWFELRFYGEQLGTVQVRCREKEKRLTVCCVEYPRKLTDHLEGVLQKNGIDLNPELD